MFIENHASIIRHYSSMYFIINIKIRRLGQERNQVKFGLYT